ncbi:hypothetical protein [Flavobacterium geliluteum]|uniref:Uncharacterized protein n=1 Tax=Flavobacterium geliluteum TaxID=2816120 RepID=A0A941AW70_9FLAO|nr:hypothetical protein [Flavobacterium geliluteum]MBP4137320.1 hypothetical protein [Flavobacterium geliluteum]
MKLFAALILWITVISAPDIASIRKMYPTVGKSEANAKEFTAKLAGIANTDETILVAYKAASILLDSKYEKKLSSKMNRFKEGAKLLESTITSEPNSVEIRMIRLSIQENVPGITGYKKNIKEDKAFIIAHINEQNATLKEYIKAFIVQSKSFSAKEKQSAK